MRTRRIVASVLALTMLSSGPGFVWAADAPPPAPAAPPVPEGAEVPTPSTDVTPARVSYLNGEVSFWRPGAQDWAPAKLNTPLAPGDVLYAGQSGNVEIEIGPSLVGRVVQDLNISTEIKVVAITRGGKAFIPSSSTPFEMGDLLHVAVLRSAMERFEELTQG